MGFPSPLTHVLIPPGNFSYSLGSAGTYTLHVDAPDGQGHSLTPPPSHRERRTLRRPSRPSCPQSIFLFERESSLPEPIRNVSPARKTISPLMSSSWLAAARCLKPDTARGRSSENGRFFTRIQNIAPGTYNVEINPNGALYVQSATSGTTNLLESDLSIAPAARCNPSKSRCAMTSLRSEVLCP